ncbi:HAMP domain-containing protein [Candidatus Electronema sp. JM]|uniref:sensor histidine kinase n=1 Tax=Candidatus Electronema sp. JM TaxID=3401571 RepID=UPI003AA96405
MALNAATSLELKKLLLSLEQSLREKRIDREKIAAEAAQLQKLIGTHAARHTHTQTDPAGQAAHEMLHHSVLAMSLSKYILNESAGGWPEQEFAQIAAVVRQELEKMGEVIDGHLQLHLQELTKTEAFVSEQYEHTLLVVVLTSAAAALLAVMVFILLMRSVLRPVQVLQEGTRQLGAGNLQHRPLIRSGDEFEFLAEEFGKMAEQLAEYHGSLEQKVQERTQELLHANAELRRAEEQVHQLSQELLTVQERERQQIALYLHDQVAQELSSLKIAAGALFSGSSVGQEEELHDWSGQLDRCIRTVRELSYNLRPPGLEQIGLASALADLCRDFLRRTGVAVRFSAVGAEHLQLEFKYAINIYRLAQEALNNISKHAAAGRAELRLIVSGSSLILRIDDKGCGFLLPETYSRARQEKRFGLLGMEERVRMMQGLFRIQSAPQEGTRIFVEFPGLIAAPPDEEEPLDQAELQTGAEP